MCIENYIDQLRRIQEKLLLFLDEEEESNMIYEDLQIQNDQHTLKLLLFLICKIANNHHRKTTFFEKINLILLHFKDDIKNFFSDWEIFNIFKSNKRILLLLIEEKMIMIDQSMINQITTEKYQKANYPQYLYPEISKYIDSKFKPDDDDVDFEKNRKIGENPSIICKLIQDDSFDDFVQYVNKENIPLQTQIKSSIYETNSFLIDKSPTLIEYAAFYGSIQIFNYLKVNQIQLTQSLWLYAIHSNNAEIISLLDENKIKPDDESFKECFIESIKCHHNDMANYFFNNFLDKKASKPIILGSLTHKTGYSVNYSQFLEYLDYSLISNLKYYNFNLIESSKINKSSFQILCKYDYYKIVDILLKEKNIDINCALIYEINLMKFQIN